MTFFKKTSLACYDLFKKRPWACHRIRRGTMTRLPRRIGERAASPRPSSHFGTFLSARDSANRGISPAIRFPCELTLPPFGRNDLSIWLIKPLESTRRQWNDWFLYRLQPTCWYRGVSAAASIHQPDARGLSPIASRRASAASVAMIFIRIRGLSRLSPRSSADFKLARHNYALMKNSDRSNLYLFWFPQCPVLFSDSAISLLDWLQFA